VLRHASRGCLLRSLLAEFLIIVAASLKAPHEGAINVNACIALLDFFQISLRLAQNLVVFPAPVLCMQGGLKAQPVKLLVLVKLLASWRIMFVFGAAHAVPPSFACRLDRYGSVLFQQLADCGRGGFIPGGYHQNAAPVAKSVLVDEELVLRKSLSPVA